MVRCATVCDHSGSELLLRSCAERRRARGQVISQTSWRVMQTVQARKYTYERCLLSMVHHLDAIFVVIVAPSVT